MVIEFDLSSPFRDRGAIFGLRGQGRTCKEFMGWGDVGHLGPTLSIQKRFCEGIMLNIVDAPYFHAHCFTQFLLLRQ